MTSLAVLSGADTHGPSSLYLLSDSRVSWTGTKNAWDFGRKTFYSRKTADIFGYCGDVLFPAVILPQVIAVVDAGLSLKPTASFGERFGLLVRHVREAFQTYPQRAQPVTIVHGGRDGVGMSSTFRVGVLQWSSSTRSWLKPIVKSPPRESGITLTYGSGAASIRRAIEDWKGTADATTRHAFAAFIESLVSARDKHSGGPPQLVGLYRIGVGRQFGILFRKGAYVGGLPVGKQNVESIDVEWRNEAFERVEVTSRRRVSGAQRHRDVAARQKRKTTR